MSDYISKSALFREFSDFVRASNNSDFEDPPTWNDAVSLVGSMPTVDAVPVTRCRDCKHKDKESGFCAGRGWPMQLVADDGFCENGGRREDD